MNIWQGFFAKSTKTYKKYEMYEITDYGKIYISFFLKKVIIRIIIVLRRISMKGSMNTHMGNIYIDPEVIAQYAEAWL